MYLYLLPIERIGNWRVPRYLKSRMQDGLDCKWALKDFGVSSEIGLVTTDQTLRGLDILGLPAIWSTKQRERVGGYLQAAGIESRWVKQAADWREAWQRIAGLTQVYQSAVDDPFTSLEKQDPTVWLGREIFFGFEKLNPLDMQMFYAEQDAQRWRIGDWVLLGRSWLNEITGRVVPMNAFGALPATDTFTTGADAAIATYSANWTVNNGAFQVLAATDDVRANSLAECCAHWNADAFNNDQYSQVRISQIGAGNWIGASARAAAAAATYYGFYGTGLANSNYLHKSVAGVYTDLSGTAGTAAFVVNDVIKITCSSTTITPNINSATTGTQGAQTDSSVASGSGGIVGYGTVLSFADDWQASNNSTGRTTKNTDPQPLGVFAGVSRRTSNTP